MRVTVEIDIPNVDVATYEAHKDDWHPTEPGSISIDTAYLTDDPTDDSFRLFKLIKVEE